MQKISNQIIIPFQPSPLFNKIEVSKIEKLRDQFSGRQKSKTPDGQDVQSKSAQGDSSLSEYVDEASLEAAITAQVCRNLN